MSCHEKAQNTQKERLERFTANIRKGNLQAFENILQPVYFVITVLFVAIPIAVFGITRRDQSAERILAI